MTERQWQTIRLAFIFAVLTALVWPLFGCALRGASPRAPAAACWTDECGVVCCNDDGQTCPYCHVGILVQ